MDVGQQLTALHSLHLHDRIRHTAQLVTGLAEELVQDASTGPAVRTQLQACLCKTLLQSVQPHVVMQHSSSNTKVAQTILPTLSAQLPSTSSSPESQQQDIPVQHDAVLATEHLGNPTANKALNPSCCSRAEAWHAAGPALQAIYTWEDEQVVLDVISFWASISDVLYGSWLQQVSSQPEASRSSSPTLPAANSISPSDQQKRQQENQQQYIQWLLSLGYPALSALMNLLHDFYHLTGICQLQHKQRTPELQLLLLFLQLGSTEHCSTKGKSELPSSTHNPAAPTTAVQQFLQAAHWPTLPGTQQQYSISGNFAHNQTDSSIAASVGAALRPTEAFTAVLKLSQLASMLPAAAVSSVAEGNAAKATADGSSSSTSADLALWQQLAVAAGQFLQASYGWCHQDGRPITAPAAMHGIRNRPFDTPYDLCIIELFYAMLVGPTSMDSRDRVEASVVSAAPGVAVQAGNSVMKQKKRVTWSTQASAEQQWEDWCSSDGFRALTELIVAYDKPQQLVSGLVTLAVQQLQCKQQEQQQPGFVQTAASNSQAEKATISRVMLLLEYTYLWKVHSSDGCSTSSSKQAADAAGVRQLLQGCAELLRPAANCTVEWRCAALALMISAVEDFMAKHPDDGLLHTQVWCRSSLEGLFYCLNHDPSIKARRSAMKLLQLVALPAGSSAAQELLQTLATKACDKDKHVATAALELLVQLDAGVLCNSLTAEQFLSMVHAGLELCSSAGSGTDAMHTANDRSATQRSTSTETEIGGSKPVLQANGTRAAKAAGAGGKQLNSVTLSTIGQKQFLQLLRGVLLSANGETESVQQQVQMMGVRQWLVANAQKAVGVGGCRLMLLMLLQDARLAVTCGKLSCCLTQA